MLRDVVFIEIFTILLVVCLLLVAITKWLFARRFQDFILIIFNFRYLKVYSRDQKFFDVFEGLLFTNLVIGISIFGFISYNNGFKSAPDAQTIIYKLAFAIALFIMIKVLIERLISSVLNIDFIINDYLFEKISYKNFLGLLLIPINAIFLYTITPTKILLFIAGLILFVIHSLGLLFFIKNNLKAIKNNLFYFILYLCALEISPYVVLYKLITKY